MRDKRIKASAETIAKALVGDYRREHLFTLRQSLQAYRQCQDLIAACDREIEQYLKEFDSKLDPTQTPLAKPKDRHKPRRNEMKFDLRAHLYRIFGVDLTEIPGINALTAHVLFAEIGPDLSRFANASAFVPGRVYALTIESAVARFSPSEPGLSKIERLWLFACLRRHYTEASRT